MILGTAGGRDRAVDTVSYVQNWRRTVDDPWLHVRRDPVLGELARIQHRFDDAVVLSEASLSAGPRAVDRTRSVRGRRQPVEFHHHVSPPPSRSSSRSAFADRFPARGTDPVTVIADADANSAEFVALLGPAVAPRSGSYSLRFGGRSIRAQHAGWLPRQRDHFAGGGGGVAASRCCSSSSRSDPRHNRRAIRLTCSSPDSPIIWSSRDQRC